MAGNQSSRRDVLKSLSSASIALGAGTAGASQAKIENEVDSIDAEIVSGHKRAKGLHSALKNNDVRKLLENYHQSKGRVRDLQGAVVSHVTEKNGEDRYVVLLPLIKPGTDSRNRSLADYDSFILYNGLEDISADLIGTDDLRNVQGYELGVNNQGSKAQVQSTDTGTNIKATYIENGSLTSEVASVSEPDIQTQDQETIQKSQFCTTCTQTKTKCQSTNWGCVLLTASTYGASIIACGSCALTSGILIAACGYCLTNVMAAGAASLMCDIGEDCEEITECVDESLEDRVCCPNYKVTSDCP